MKIVRVGRTSTPLGEDVALEPEQESAPSIRVPGLLPRASVHPSGPASLIAAQNSKPVLHPFVAGMEEESRSNALRYREQNLRLLAERGVADPEAELLRLETVLRSRQQLLMRRSVRGLSGLLLDGKIKTVYEVPDKRVGPEKYLEYRRETEERLGYFEHRPCYGYVSFDPQMTAAPTEFGDIILTLRGKSCRERVVFCEFDSFDHESRESYRSKAFLWDDVVHLALNQMLDGTLENMPYAYDEAQIFAPRGRPLDNVTLADVESVAIPSSSRFDAIAAEVRRTAPWVSVTRYEDG